ncbi:ribosome small subunit-dependent GTPase A [Paraglaciecola aquimarina]|uniref:Small ribosomal subunit biogenesis GTPase RsgA n=1 Tax=Paraglaciecola algarum TaxID=3050085 RepID=A0ABS9D4L0_9ALTE|nr:ribosome small subunit-dependent GTPase A [Paraglaciecola sp. G1-23]MCF2947864.1 ribosome small subunit-dependent GTPase A [Paraglaciecola sp. G1-23]
MSEKQYSLSQLGWKPYFNQQLNLDELENCAPFRVVQVFRNRLLVWGENVEKSISLAEHPELTECTVGDWILFSQTSESHQTDQTIRILERASFFQRKAPGSISAQLIAANIDTAFIVSSCNQDFNLSRIERYLALAKEAQTEAVLVLTKSDLVDQEQQYAYLDQLNDLQPHLMVVLVNALDPESCKPLLDWYKTGQTCVLLGSSGVGKTTLTNTLCATEEKTAPIREDDSKGRHTTTARALFFTQSGGLILDCPGMRELQLTDCEEGVKAVFDDIQQLALKCKFSDCQHQLEPKCAVQAAIVAGTLDERRLVNYQKMLNEQTRNTMSLAESHQKDREFGKLIKSSQQLKKTTRET